MQKNQRGHVLLATNSKPAPLGPRASPHQCPAGAAQSLRHRSYLQLRSNGDVLSRGCSGSWVGKGRGIQPLGALTAFINMFARQQAIVEVGSAPCDVPHHPSRDQQL